MSRIRIYSLRGNIYFYKWLNRFYKALLMTWHKDYSIALLALATFVVSCLMIVISVYAFSCGVAMLMHVNSEGVGWIITSFCTVVVARYGFKLSEAMLPIKKAGDEQDEQDNNSANIR